MDEVTQGELVKRIEELESELDHFRHLYEDSLSRERRYFGLIEHMQYEAHVWDLVYDDEGEIRTWRLVEANPAALQVWGKRIEDVVGKTTDEIFPNSNPTEQFMPIIRKIFDEGAPHLWEQYFEATDQYLQMLSIPCDGYFISVGFDISQYKQMQDALQHRSKMEAIGRLAGGVAHDFNNQLTGILGYAELLRSEIDDKRLRGHLDHIVAAARRSADLTAQLLAFARKGEIAISDVRVDALIMETVQLLEHSVKKSIVISSSLGAGRALVHGDPTALQNAFLNIAVNACDSMPNGGALHVETRVIKGSELAATAGDVLRHAEGCVCIRIQDTGVGMAPEVMERVFEPFFTTRAEGTGMGLASAYGAVQQHHGHIEVSSVEGEGTCFTVWLPVAAESDEERPGTRRELRSDSDGWRILVVDDEASVRHLFHDFLTNIGHDAVVVADGHAAIECYRSEWQSIDLVILDMLMPGLTGLETFRQLREINPDVTAVIATGYSAEGTRDECIDAGVAGFMKKPFELLDLHRVIQEMVRK